MRCVPPRWGWCAGVAVRLECSRRFDADLLEYSGVCMSAITLRFQLQNDGRFPDESWEPYPEASPRKKIDEFA